MRDTFSQLTALARGAAEWPEDVICYQVEVIGQGPDPQVMLTGEKPVGLKRNGDPKFGTKQRQFRAVVLLSKYRAALGVAA